MRKIGAFYQACGAVALAFIVSACGTSLERDFLTDGQILERGSTSSVSIPVNFSYQNAHPGCRVIPTSSDESACTRQLEVGVLLPKGIIYAGEPEARVEVRDVIAGENGVPEPSVHFCEGGEYQVLHFSIPPMEVDSDDEDTSIVEDIIDDILDSASEQFVFKVRGDEVGNGGELLFVQRLSDFSPAEFCPPSDSTEKLFSVRVE